MFLVLNERERNISLGPSYLHHGINQTPWCAAAAARSNRMIYKSRESIFLFKCKCVSASLKRRYEKDAALFRIINLKQPPDYICMCERYCHLF